LGTDPAVRELSLVAREKVLGMRGGFDRHFPEAVWEEYAMGLRSEEDCKLLEEHLLICAACQDLLAEADEYIQVAKAATVLTAAMDTPDRPLITDFRMRRRLSKPVQVAAALAGSLLWLS
jgi:predicted anti-sigma-YlaC factor YlaD